MPKPAVTRINGAFAVQANTLPNNGLYAPRLTTTQRNAIPASVLANGAIIYNTTTNQFQVYENDTWTILNTGVSSFVLKRIETTNNYQILITDVIIAVTNTTAPRAITLPLITNTTIGQVFIIKDETNNAATNNITIARNGANIDGQAADKVINTDSGVVKLYSIGTAWFTI